MLVCRDNPLTSQKNERTSALRRVCEEDGENKAGFFVLTQPSTASIKRSASQEWKTLKRCITQDTERMERMSSSEESNEQQKGDLLSGSRQVTTLQRLLCLQSDIEAQDHRVMMAVTPITAALANGKNVSHEMRIHVKAQILKAHLQLDDLEQVIDSLA